MIIFDQIPYPTHKVNIGAIANIGIACVNIIKGSSHLLVLFEIINKIPVYIPNIIPNKNPIKISQNVMNEWYISKSRLFMIDNNTIYGLGKI